MWAKVWVIYITAVIMGESLAQYNRGYGGAKLAHTTTAIVGESLAHITAAIVGQNLFHITAIFVWQNLACIITVTSNLICNTIRVQVELISIRKVVQQDLF